jgi:hypothetical protein
VDDVIGDDGPEVPLPERYDAPETLLLDRAHESLGVGVKIRTPRW